jgi:hypothetical protein
MDHPRQHLAAAAAAALPAVAKARRVGGAARGAAVEVGEASEDLRHDGARLTLGQRLGVARGAGRRGRERVGGGFVPGPGSKQDAVSGAGSSPHPGGEPPAFSGRASTQDGGEHPGWWRAPRMVASTQDGGEHPGWWRAPRMVASTQGCCPLTACSLRWVSRSPPGHSSSTVAKVLASTSKMSSRLTMLGCLGAGAA